MRLGLRPRGSSAGVDLINLEADPAGSGDPSGRKFVQKRISSTKATGDFDRGDDHDPNGDGGLRNWRSGSTSCRLASSRRTTKDEGATGHT